MAFKSSLASRNAAANARALLCNNGYLCYYTGSQPSSPDVPATGTLLCSLRFGSPAFGGASGGVITANAITADPNAANSGTAGWFRIYESDNSTAVFDGTIGTDLTMNSTLIQAGANVSCSSFTITEPQ